MITLLGYINIAKGRPCGGLLRLPNRGIEKLVPLPKVLWSVVRSGLR